MFSHYPAAATSLDNSPDRLRSARVCVADNCRAGDAATLLSGEQPTGERELGLWIRPKSAEDSARAAVCDCFNAAIPAHCLSANPPSLHYNLSPAGAVTGDTAPAAASSLCKSCRADKNAGAVIWKIFKIVLWIAAGAYGVVGVLYITVALGTAREAASLRIAYIVFGSLLLTIGALAAVTTFLANKSRGWLIVAPLILCLGLPVAAFGAFFIEMEKGDVHRR